MGIECLCISVLREVSGPRVKLVDCKSALKPTVVYTADRSKALVPGVALTLCSFVVWFYKVIYIKSCPFIFSVLLALRLSCFGKSLCTFRTFVCFKLVDLRLFPFPLGVRDWLRLVIVSLPGLFFLPFIHRDSSFFERDVTLLFLFVYNIVLVLRFVMWRSLDFYLTFLCYILSFFYSNQ